MQYYLETQHCEELKISPKNNSYFYISTLHLEQFLMDQAKYQHIEKNHITGKIEVRFHSI